MVISDRAGIVKRSFALLSLRCAARQPAAARKDLYLSLPSTYPFSAQARLGLCWANLWSRLTALDLSQRQHCVCRVRKACPDTSLVNRRVHTLRWNSFGALKMLPEHD